MSDQKQSPDNKPNTDHKTTGPSDRSPNRTASRPVQMGGAHMRGHYVSGQKPKDMRTTIKRLWQIFADERRKMIFVFLLATLATAFSLVAPWLIGRGVDAIDTAEGVDFPRLYIILIALGAAYSLNALLTFAHEWWIASVAQRAILLVRRSLFAKLQKLPLSFFDTHTHGELMSRLANDTDNVSMMISSSTTQFFSSVLMFVGSLAMMLYLSPLLTLLTLITLPLTLFLTNGIAKKARRKFRDQQIQLATLNGHIEEILSGQEVVKAFGREKHVIQQFDDVNEKLRETGLKAQIWAGLVMPMLNAITNLGFVIIVAAGGYLVVSDIVTIGVITSFITYSRQFARPLNEIANLYSSIQSAQASAERIFELMDEIPEPPDSESAKMKHPLKGEISFADVCFGYRPDVPVLQDVDLLAKPGQTIALVGPTGAGKTTVVNLLVRFYDPTSGTITLDGLDLLTWQRSALRSSFGMVLQDTHLFSGSIRDNIRYGRLDATDEEIETASSAVGADAFIRRLPDGYDTMIDESGSSFSQGQRQLLAIVRAVLAEPAVLILDEATSSVDTRTEMLLQKAMIKLRQGRTSFIIAHRLSTIRDADEILVIDDGRIIERGSHEALMASQGFYYHLYSNQFAMANGES